MYRGAALSRIITLTLITTLTGGAKIPEWLREASPTGQISQMLALKTIRCQVETFASRSQHKPDVPQQSPERSPVSQPRIVKQCPHERRKAVTALETHFKKHVPNYFRYT